MNEQDVRQRIEALIADGYPDHPDDWETDMVELLEFVTGEPQDLTCSNCGLRFWWRGIRAGNDCPQDRCTGQLHFQPPSP